MDYAMNSSELRAATEKMRGLVESGQWHHAPWAEGQFTRHFLEAIGRASTFLDIGAEVGFYSYLALKSMPPGGRILAFEADPARSAVLKEFFAPYPQVTVFDLGVDEKTQVKRLVRPTSSEYPCATIANLEGEPFEARMVRLDDFLAPDPIDVVKMDIEGAEVNALLGMTNLLKRDRPRLYFEVHPFLIERIRKGGIGVIEALFAELDYQLFNCDYGELIPIAKLLGSRLYACPRSASDGLATSSPGTLARTGTQLKVNGGLRLRRLVRELIRGY